MNGGNNSSAAGPVLGNVGRKRGHQHHIRHSGTRRSNVPADEVIAALRSGSAASTLMIDAEQQHQTSDIEMAVDNDNNNLASSFRNEDTMEVADVLMLNDDNANRALIGTSNINNRLNISAGSTIDNSIFADSTAERLNEMNVTSTDASNRSSSNCCNSTQDSAFNMEQCATDTLLLEHDLNDSISSGSSSSITKSKKKREGKKGKACNKKEKREKRTDVPRPPSEERPPLEGAAAEQCDDIIIGDIENDPEVAEWSKLRCTSERAEVVAEREYRRQNRRCADYPGLAFGRSIFSSDTMMKLNIIRNELHNIMKTQLKRVRDRE